MSPAAGTPSPAPAPGRSPPVREDCWSAEATHTLVEAWGERYLELNRGNLRQRHWREVADAVNDRHGHVRKQRRTDVQCKNRIDTLKKKYKIERARVSDSGGEYQSQWPFFARLEDLIGNSFSAKTAAPSPPVWSARPRSGTRKRPAAPAVSPISPIDDSSYFLRGYSSFSGKEDRSVEEEEDSESSRSSTVSRRRCRGVGGKGKGKEEKEAGFRELARAIERLGEIYERVEGTKQRQMIELEKQRMQFAKDLEYQRMELFMTQLQLQRNKRAKRSSGDDRYS